MQFGTQLISDIFHDNKPPLPSSWIRHNRGTTVERRCFEPGRNTIKLFLEVAVENESIVKKGVEFGSAHE